MNKYALLCISFLILAIINTSNAQWNLTGNNNAIGTSILGTTNAIPLNLTTNNVSRLVIDANGKIGISTAPALSLLTMKGAGGTPAASWISSGAPLFAGFGEGTPGNADFNLMMASGTVNARGVIGMKRSRGTLSAPAAVVNNDQLGSMLVSGFDGTNFQGAAAVDFFADGTPSAGNVPVRISFVTGSNGGNRAERLKIGNTGDITMNNNQLFVQRSTGNVGVGTLAPTAKLDINGDVLISGITAGRGRDNDTTNTAFGSNALKNNTRTSSFDGVRNTAIGASALHNNTTGYNNTAVGNSALINNTTGYANIANGGDALNSNTTGYNNTASGYQALYSNTTGNENTANGVSALTSNSTGNSNIATGAFALTSNSTGNSNVANGAFALASNTTGSNNSGNGFQALNLNTTGDYNTANGYQSLYSNSVGIRNTAIGAGASQNNTTGNGNTASGSNALYRNTAGDYNTANGGAALYNNVSGNYNTAIGVYADVALDNLNNSTAIGYQALASATNRVRIGNTSITSIGGQVAWTSFSDGRIKQNIRENVPGLTFIKLLKPVTYNYNLAKEYELMGRVDSSQYEGKNDIEKINFTGFIAQDVEAAAQKINYDFSGVDKSGNIMGLRYAEFVVPLVKAVQELAVENGKLKVENEGQQKINEKLRKASEELKMDNGQLKTQNAEHEKRIAKLEAMMQQMMNSKASIPCPPLVGQ